MIKGLNKKILPLVVASSSLASPSFATDYVLDQEFPGQNIQYALSELGYSSTYSANKPHTLIIPEGVYENSTIQTIPRGSDNYPLLDVPLDINLRGSTEDVTNLKNHVLYLRGNNTISDLKFSNDYDKPTYVAIWVQGSNVTIEDCVFEGIGPNAGDLSTGTAIFSQNHLVSGVNLISNDISGFTTPFSLNELTQNRIRENHIHNNYRGFYTNGSMDFGTESDPGNNIIRMNHSLGTVVDPAVVKTLVSEGELLNYAQFNWWYDENDALITVPEQVVSGIKYVVQTSKSDSSDASVEGLESVVKSTSIPTLILTEVNQQPHPDYPGTQTSSVGDSWMKYE